MNIYSGLLFLEGHVANPDLMRSLAGEAVGQAMPATAMPPAPAAAHDQPMACRRGAIATVCGALSLSPFR